MLTAVLCSVLAANPTKTTPDGVVEGITQNNYDVFRGIPYAKPPVRNLRFKAPVPAAAWGGVLDATNFGASCSQPGSAGTGFPPGWPSINVTVSSEDCLFVNVFTPSGLTEGSNAAVMVYFHAGEFEYGSSNDVENNFPYFTKDNILVTANSRLGVLGYTGFSGLAKEDPSGMTGNYGTLDQQLILKWVHRSISSFGGDPTRVAIFGESSGGSSVAFHLTSKTSWPYFQRAILESPGVTQTKQLSHAEDNARYLISNLAVLKSTNCVLSKPIQYQAFPGHAVGWHNNYTKATLDELKAQCTADSKCMLVVYDYVNKQGRLSHEGSPVMPSTTMDIHVKWANMSLGAECLRSADVNEMIKLTGGGEGIWGDTFNTDKYAPVIDGAVLNASLQALVREGQLANVPIISGSNMDEGTMFMELVPHIACNASYEDYSAWCLKQFGTELGNQLPSLYKNLNEPLPYCYGGDNTDRANNYWYMAAMRTAGDSAILCRGKEILETATQPSYQYYFTHTPNYSMNYNNIPYLGAFHGAEVPFAFGDQFEMTTPAERVLTAEMGCFWSNFAQTGDPNKGTQQCSYTWPSFKDEGSYLVLTNTSLVALKGLQQKQCDLFRNYP